MKNAWSRLGTPGSISWVMISLVFVQQVSGSLVAPFVDVTDRLAEFIGVRVASVAILAGVLGLGRLLLNRIARRKSRPIITLLILIAAGVASTVTVNGLLILTGFTDEWTVGRRLIVAIPGLFTIMIISALLVANARELARQNQELAERAEELVTTRAQANARLNARRENLITSVQNEIDRSLGATGATPDSFRPQHLKQLLDDVVRPMSYRLSWDFSGVSPRDINIANPRVSWTEIFRNAVMKNPAHPLATAIWIGALLGSFLITGFGLAGLAATGAYVGTSLALLYPTRITWRFIPVGVAVWLRAVLFSVIVIGSAVVSAIFITSLTGYSFLVPHALIGWVILAFFMTWSVTLFFTVNDTLRETKRHLEETVDELKREVIHLNNELRLLQTSISRALHGPIQDAISASIHLLQTQETDSSDREITAEVSRRMETALASLTTLTQSHVSLEAALNDLVELWDSIVTIEIQIDPNATSRLENDPGVTAALVELIREACGNAIRHGDAATVKISVALIDPSLVSLTVVNDGAAIDASARHGLGSQMFDELCLSWSRSNEANLVRVNARIPIAS